MKKKALIAMSGGVDSSVAAKEMLNMGYDCCGCTMRLLPAGAYETPSQGPDTSPAGNADDPSKDAEKVCRALGIPFFSLDLCSEFHKNVILRFVSAYEKGLTPNPCIDCNRTMKFGLLLEHARREGYDALVTGHYARTEQDKDGRFLLKKALDPSKDQSYVLYNLTQEELSVIRFPLGSLTKARVRELAAASGFINAQKKESQDICFVPDGDYAGMIQALSGRQYEPGNFVDLTGRVLGTHRGIIHYTIGQRKGLNIAFGTPKYVYRIIPERNEVVLADNEELYDDTVHVTDFNWINGPPKGEFRCSVKIRYRQCEQPALIIPEGDRAVTIKLESPQRAVTPGQAAVLYAGDTVLGGGTITRQTNVLHGAADN